jgi:cardiolipin-specific phospholipase
MRGLWTPSSDKLLLAAQKKLLAHFVRTPLHQARLKLPKSGHSINYVDTHGKDASPAREKQSNAPPVAPAQRTLLLMHGFGSGLGFFFENYDALHGLGNTRVIAADWLGMGGSSRPGCGKAPRAPLLSAMPFSTQQAIDFFVDSLEEWRQAMKLERFTLAGHSLGGYLSAQYALKYPKYIDHLVLVSPVGVPIPSTTPAGPRQPLPWMLRVLDVAWSANVTPQGILRAYGRRGPDMVKRGLVRRFGPRWSEEETALLADYLYQISVAPASGEYAMNSLLVPMLSPDQPRGVYARSPLAHHLRKLVSMRVTLIFGDKDWLYHPGS